MPGQFSRIVKAVQLAKQAFGPYKPQIALLSFLSFISGALEGIGVNAIIPLLAIVTGTASGGSDFISRTINQLFVFLNVDFSIKFILLFIALLFVLKTVAVLLINYIKVSITSSYEKDIRDSLFQNMLRADWSYLSKQKLGHLETVLMTNVRFGSELLGQVSEVIIAGIGLVIYSVVAFNISVNITLVTLLIGLTLLVTLKPLLKRTRQAASATAHANKKAAHFINENMLGMKTVKATGVGNMIAQQGASIFELFKQLRIRLMLLKSVGGSLFQPMSIIFVCVVFGISYKLPEFSFIAFVAVVYLIQRIFAYTQQLQGNLNHMTESFPYLQNILEYEKESKKHAETWIGTKPFNFQHELTFNSVAFSYGSGEVLKEINFAIPKGAFYGIVGASGSGKTTLVDLLLGLYRPTVGVIRLDGTPLQEIDIREWRTNLGYVSQDMFLLNDSISNNIRFLDPSIRDREIEEAAKMAQCYDFVKEMPEGFDTVVGERGIRLSVGQRQRVVIARVLARKPQILVLDEATSALDNESEAQIQRVIENLRHGITVVIIAHRLSTVMNTDAILVLDDGKIIEEGNPKALLEKDGSAFQKLYSAGK